MPKYTQEMHAAHVEAEEKRKAEEEQARRERTEKESARRVWLSDGGRAEDFAAQWPKLRDEARKQRVMNADKQAREAHTRSRVSRI